MKVLYRTSIENSKSKNKISKHSILRWTRKKYSTIKNCKTSIKYWLRSKRPSRRSPRISTKGLKNWEAEKSICNSSNRAWTAESLNWGKNKTKSRRWETIWRGRCLCCKGKKKVWGQSTRWLLMLKMLPKISGTKDITNYVQTGRTARSIAVHPPSPGKPSPRTTPQGLPTTKYPS